MPSELIHAKKKTQTLTSVSRTASKTTQSQGDGSINATKLLKLNIRRPSISVGSPYPTTRSSATWNIKGHITRFSSSQTKLNTPRKKTT